VETSPSETEAEPPETDVPEVIIPPSPPIPAVVTQLLMFDSSLENLRKRKAPQRATAAFTPSSQLGLF
jgi:hypothetical protein